MVLNNNKQINDDFTTSDWNESATAVNKIIENTLETSNISDFDTGVSNNSSVIANTAKVGVTTEISNVVEDVTPQLGGNLDCQSFDLEAIKTAEFTVNTIGNSGASKTVTLEDGGMQTITLDQNTTLTIASTTVTRSSLIISGGASYTITWSGVTWLTSGGTAPTLDGNDVVTFINDGSTIWATLSNQS